MHLDQQLGTEDVFGENGFSGFRSPDFRPIGCPCTCECTNHIHIYGAWALGARKTDCHLNMHLQLGILELPIDLQSNQQSQRGTVIT